MTFSSQNVFFYSRVIFLPGKNKVVAVFLPPPPTKKVGMSLVAYLSMYFLTSLSNQLLLGFVNLEWICLLLCGWRVGVILKVNHNSGITIWLQIILYPNCTVIYRHGTVIGTQFRYKGDITYISFFMSNSFYTCVFLGVFADRIQHSGKKVQKRYFEFISAHEIAANNIIW